MAIFVEGQTEQLFVLKLLRELAGKKHLSIECTRSRGGSSVAKSITSVLAETATHDVKWYVQIVDCGTDNRVASEIRDEYNRLVNADFTEIIGLRDLFPLSRKDLHEVGRAMTYKLQTKPIAVLFVIAVMEVEAWFLAEHTHFTRIDADLTAELVSQRLGFDPRVDDMELRAEPAADLSAAYSLVKKSYAKKKSQVQRTVDAIDYAEAWMNLPDRLPSFRPLIQKFDSFFAV